MTLDAAQFAELLNHIDQAGYLVGGLLLALIFAVTWKG